MEKSLGLKDITPISNISESYSHAGHDYIFSHMVLNKDNTLLDTSDIVRFEGLTIVVVIKGDFVISLNSNEHVMPPNSITIMGPNDVISRRSSVTEGFGEIYTLFLSTELLQGINFDVNVLNPRYLIHHEPVVKLNPDEISLTCDYLQLLHRCALKNNEDGQQLTLITRSIGRNIVVALLYQIALFNELRQRRDGVDLKDDTNVSYTRKVNYVHEFMRLLQENYKSHRTVTFYAGKMCISPKYLSLLVKEMTGQSAAAIIDRHVVNEAKNLLRFSGLTIQQIAYKLNFPNQSAFGKYFKHLTGVSPTVFRSN